MGTRSSFQISEPSPGPVARSYGGKASVVSRPSQCTCNVYRLRRTQTACYATPDRSTTTVSWGGELPDARTDWDVPPCDSDAEVEEELDAELDVFGPSGFGFQNALATVLLAALALSLANVLLKLAVVAFALISAAFRYSVIGILAIVILAMFS